MGISVQIVHFITIFIKIAIKTDGFLFVLTLAIFGSRCYYKNEQLWMNIKERNGYEKV